MHIKEIHYKLKMVMLFTVSLFGNRVSFSQMSGMDMLTTLRPKLFRDTATPISS